MILYLPNSHSYRLFLRVGPRTAGVQHSPEKTGVYQVLMFERDGWKWQRGAFEVRGKQPPNLVELRK
jgi:hypothetical protein